MQTFESLGLSKPILKALAAEKYDNPTPIQTQAIPIALSGRDIIGLAQTGTGKTAAFALPILDRLAAGNQRPVPRTCRALVLAPTRELAAQIADSFRAYGKFTGLSSTVVFGGVPINRQKSALNHGVDILVATPGRLLDLIQQRSVRLDSVEYLVLDEADHMMDLGFIVPLKRIAKMLPEKRQTLFFSATMPPPIAELAAQFLTDPLQVAVAPVSSTAERVEQAVIHCEQSKKQDVLHDLLKDKSIARALVFTRTKHGADRVVKRLEEAGYPAEAIHGNKKQGQRERALDAFKKGRARLLVATEIAARGIDVDNVSHVINFDLPDVPEQYVHRIGRTARAGLTGHAISFCAHDERGNLRDIERLTKQPVPVLQHALSLPAPQPRDPNAPRPQGRKPVQRQRTQRTPYQSKEGRGEQRHGENRGEYRGDNRGEQRHAAPRGENRGENRGDHRNEQRQPEHRGEHRPSDHRPSEHRHADHRSAEHRRAEHRGGEHKPQADRPRRPEKAYTPHIDKPQRVDGPREHSNREQGPRDNGDRRDRKGHDVWSNGPVPRARNAPRRAPRV